MQYLCVILMLSRTLTVMVKEKTRFPRTEFYLVILHINIVQNIDKSNFYLFVTVYGFIIISSAVIRIYDHLRSNNWHSVYVFRIRVKNVET